MLETELIELVKKITEQKCESNYLEIKSAEKGCPKIIDTLSAFSNQSGGGKIVFGIDESQGYKICGVYDAADLQKKIMEQCKQMQPPVRPLCTVATIEDCTVVCAEIQEIDNADKPCYYQGSGRLKGSYVRTADGDVHMTEYEVYSYEAFRKRIHDELRIAERANLNDLYTDDFEQYVLTLKKKKPNFKALSKEEICRLQGFTNENQPTLTGILLFGLFPQAFFPQLRITAVSVAGTEIGMTGNIGERFIDNCSIEGTIVQMQEDALQFIRKNMKIKTIIDEQTGNRKDMTEYPVIAVREIILNALIHRDYSVHTESAPITIRMFSNRMEVENPGGLYGRMTLDQLGKISADTRNPFLAGAMEVLGKTENRYTGIPTIISAMKEQGLPAPEFVNERGVFKVILYNQQESSQQFLSDVMKEILVFCKQPRTRSQLEQLFRGRFTIPYLMKQYVHPLTEKGLLGMTIPEKPKSKKQQYFTVKL